MKTTPLAIALTVALSFTPAFAKQDHASEYQAGTFSSTGQLSDGSIAQCAGGYCSTRGASHNIHYVRTDDGMYVIQAPINVAASIVTAYFTYGLAPTVHKEWFMDQLHEGDKVLFRSKCNKHGDCQIWLPSPDKQGYEYRTLGYFRPDHAQTNTAALCASGKLSAAVQASVCSVKPAASVAAPAGAYEPIAAPAPVAVSGSVAAPVTLQYRELQAPVAPKN